MKPKGEWTAMRRKDLGLLIVVGMLFAVMTFNLGLYWGVRWSARHSAATAGTAHPPVHHATPAPHTIEVKTEVAPAGAATDSDWQAKKEIPQSVRDAFVKSKQMALIEQQLRAQDRRVTATSIADTEAYFQEKKLKWGEAPAEVQALSARTPASEASQAAAKAKPTTPIAKNLFERSPASVKSFSPVPGQHTIQVASYATEDEAVARVKLLISQGASDAYYRATKVREETWYQVSVGSFADPKWAKRQADQFVRRQIASEYFVRKIP